MNAIDGNSTLPMSAAGQISGNANANQDDFMALFAQSTAQTLTLQMAMISHNLTVGPAMKAKEASEDAKK